MDKISIKDYEKYIKALSDISSAITSDLYIEEILKLIVMVTAKVTGLEICSLWLVDNSDNQKKIRLKATQAIDPEYVQDRSLDFNEGIVGYVVSNNEPLILKDVIKDSRFKEKKMAKKLGLASMLSIPLQVKKGEVIGVLNCFTAVPHDFTDPEINLITAVANQAAVAILNTELMVKSKVIQEELETRKLVERAKEIIMNRKKVSGNEAFRWIQKQSMNSRKSMRQIAEAILLSEDIG
ncbi:MAG: GAF and ANTAR domain-containing protein [Desulfobacteraceae bacterium]|jgi:signal transduction protein with GAF and PtsI domain